MNEKIKKQYFKYFEKHKYCPKCNALCDPPLLNPNYYLPQNEIIECPLCHYKGYAYEFLERKRD